MRWTVILASLLHSHCASLSFVGYCLRSKAAFTSLQSRVFEISRSSPFPQERVSAIPKSGNTSVSRVPARAATTLTKTGKTSSVKATEERFRLPSVEGDFKAAHAEDDNPDIVSLDSITQSSKYVEGQGGRRSFVQLAFDVRNRSATRKPKGGSKGQMSSGEESFSSDCKAGIVIERPAAAVGVSEEDATAFARSDSVGSRLGCLSEGEASPECFECVEEGGDNVGDKLKKSFLQIAFPVTVFSEWWFYCFLRGYRPYPETFYCLDKLYIWLGAYQRAHFDATGLHITGHRAALLSKELEGLKIAVTSKVFRWGNTKHIYLHSPLDYAKKSSSILSDVDMTFTFQDRVVQEVLYLILEPMFEARFSTRSHASRPSRGAHTALRAAQRSFLGCNWFISGDLRILQEADYASHLVNTVLRVVKDSRITFLLQRAFLRDELRKEKHKGMCSSFLTASEGSCGRLKHLLCNVLLDSLDWWMDAQISSFTKGEPLRKSVTSHSDQSSKRELFKPLTNHLKHPCKLEYVRYGTKFWVGCSGTEKEARLIQKDIFSFLKKQFGNCLESDLLVSHLSAGVNILDHVISQKIVHPVYMRRRASSGRLFEKRALRIKLCAKASIECCLKYLKKVGVPASLQHIEEILSVLNYWYCYAENKEKVLTYCKLALCHMYSTQSSIGECKEGSVEGDFAEHFKKAVETVVYPKTEHGHPDGGKCFIRIPEHEKIFRDHAWLQSRAVTLQLKDSFKNMRKTSPQQSMSQVLWQHSRAENGDNGWDLSAQMQTYGLDQGSVIEDLAESEG